MINKVQQRSWYWWPCVYLFRTNRTWVWSYHESREEPEVHVAVELLVDGQVAGVALHIGPWQLSHHTQLPGCGNQDVNTNWWQHKSNACSWLVGWTLQLHPCEPVRQWGSFSHLHLWLLSPGTGWGRGGPRGRLRAGRWHGAISGRRRRSSPWRAPRPDTGPATANTHFPSAAWRHTQQQQQHTVWADTRAVTPIALHNSLTRGGAVIRRINTHLNVFHSPHVQWTCPHFVTPLVPEGEVWASEAEVTWPALSGSRGFWIFPGCAREVCTLGEVWQETRFKVFESDVMSDVFSCKPQELFGLLWRQKGHRVYT